MGLMGPLGGGLNRGPQGYGQPGLDGDDGADGYPIPGPQGVAGPPPTYVWQTWTATVTQDVSVSIAEQNCYYLVVGPITFFFGEIVVSSSGTNGAIITIGNQPTSLQCTPILTELLGTPIGIMRVAHQGSWFATGDLYATSAQSWSGMEYDNYGFWGQSYPNHGFALASTDVIFMHGFLRNS